MEVILLERVGRLGHMGDIVRVKDGFARNFLLPKGKALRATKENRARYEGMKADLEVRNVELRGEAQKIGGGLDGKSFIVLRQASDTGQLYGSVSGRDVAVILNESGFPNVTRGQIALNAPIKTIGLHKVPVALHPEVEITVTINVARSADEAERIARGENVIARREEPDEGESPAAGAFFDEPEETAEAAETQPAAPAAEETSETKGETKSKGARKTKAAADETGEAADAKPARKPRKARTADE
jgi:large subunit ribosomal protein L9